MADLRVLVLGGYGFFGRRLVDRLARMGGLRIQVAGRSLAAGRAFVQGLSGRCAIEAVALDARGPSFPDALRRLGPDVVVNATGPFQEADYRVPAACIAAGIHSVDLADGRSYVTGIATLHGAARAAGVQVTSGASSVPALSAAAADHLARGLRVVRSIDIGISPGNRTERGLSTVQAILTYCGRRLPAADGATVHGWSGRREHAYSAPVGRRLLSPCDVPDLVLLPSRYPGGPAVRFGAGLELRLLHRGMNVLAWTARAGLVRDWSRHAALLKAAADLFRHAGSDAGAMHVAVEGEDADGRPVARTWELLATQGDGPFVPTLAAAACIRKLRDGAVAPGAAPCVGLLALPDFEREAQGLAIRMGTLP